MRTFGSFFGRNVIIGILGSLGKQVLSRILTHPSKVNFICDKGRFLSHFNPRYYTSINTQSLSYPVKKLLRSYRLSAKSYRNIELVHMSLFIPIFYLPSDLRTPA